MSHDRYLDHQARRIAASLRRSNSSNFFLNLDKPSSSVKAANGEEQVDQPPTSSASVLEKYLSHVNTKSSAMAARAFLSPNRSPEANYASTYPDFYGADVKPLISLANRTICMASYQFQQSQDTSTERLNALSPVSRTYFEIRIQAELGHMSRLHRSKYRVSSLHINAAQLRFPADLTSKLTITTDPLGRTIFHECCSMGIVFNSHSELTCSPLEKPQTAEGSIWDKVQDTLITVAREVESRRLNELLNAMEWTVGDTPLHLLVRTFIVWHGLHKITHYRELEEKLYELESELRHCGYCCDYLIRLGCNSSVRNFQALRAADIFINFTLLLRNHRKWDSLPACFTELMEILQQPPFYDLERESQRKMELVTDNGYPDTKEEEKHGGQEVTEEEKEEEISREKYELFLRYLFHKIGNNMRRFSWDLTDDGAPAKVHPFLLTKTMVLPSSKALVPAKDVAPELINWDTFDDLLPKIKFTSSIKNCPHNESKYDVSKVPTLVEWLQFHKTENESKFWNCKSGKIIESAPKDGIYVPYEDVPEIEVMPKLENEKEEIRNADHHVNMQVLEVIELVGEEPEMTEPDEHNISKKVPYPLPPGWNISTDKHGRMYYYNIEAHSSQWHPPSTRQEIDEE